MKNTKLLEPGDVLYTRNDWGYRKIVIDRITNKQAFAGNYDKIYRTPESDGKYKAIGKYEYYELESPKVLEDIAFDERKRQFAREKRDKMDYCKDKLRYLSFDQLTRIAEIINEPK